MEELTTYRRQLAKVLNQRMVRLEQNVSPISGEAYTFGAYEQMSDYLKAQGRNRFSEVLNPKGYTKADLKKEIRVMQGFEAKASSQISGMHAIEKKRIQTLESQGISKEIATNKEFYDFLNSQTFNELSQSFNSDDVRDEYVRAAERGLTSKQIVKALTEYKEKSDRMSLKGMRKSLDAVKIRRKSWNKQSKPQTRSGWKKTGTTKNRKKR